MPLAFQTVSSRLSSLALAAFLACASLGHATDAQARGGTKAESQAQSPERAAIGGSKSKHAAKEAKATKGAKAERAARAALPAGPLPASVMTALAHAHVPLSSMSVVV